MQARTEAAANTANELFLNITRASSPRIWRMLTDCPLLGGGVCGRVRLKMLIATDAPAASRKEVGEDLMPSFPRVTPIAIHPSVPKTRIRGKSRAVFPRCCRVRELVSAMVGKKHRQYASIRP